MTPITPTTSNSTFFPLDSGSTTPIVNKSRQKKSDGYDATLSNVANSLTKLLESRAEASAAASVDLTYMQFYKEMDSVLKGIPYLEAMQFNLQMLTQAKEFAKKFENLFNFIFD